MCKRLAIMFFFLSVLTSTAFALELNINFNSNDYSSMVHVTAGATHTWLANGGWQGSGCAKFTPPTSEGYMGLSNFGRLNSRRFNIRFLYYIGSAYETGGNNKWLIAMRNPYSDGSRFIVFEHVFTQTRLSPQVCQNTGPCANSDFNLRNRLEEWICIEIESDLDANTTKLYLTTQDSAYNGTVIATFTNYSPSTGTWDYLQGLGYYYQEMGPANTNKYVKYDELRISTTGYIGPPTGFNTSIEVPQPPQRLSVQSQ